MHKITSGKIADLASNYNGWFIGHFMDQHPEFQNENFEVKWSNLKKGIPTKPKTETVQDISTMGILIYGKLEINFPTEGKKITLANEGDYAFYNPNFPHICTPLEDTLLITIRWPSK